MKRFESTGHRFCYTNWTQQQTFHLLFDENITATLEPVVAGYEIKL